MPIWLRKFTFNKIQDFYNKQKEEVESLKNNTSLIPETKNVINPPNYTMKASKK